MSQVIRYDADGHEIRELPEGYGESLQVETADPKDTIEVEVPRVTSEGEEYGVVTVMMTVEDLRDRYVELAKVIAQGWNAYGSCDSDDERDVLSSYMETLMGHVSHAGFWSGESDELPSADDEG